MTSSTFIRTGLMCLVFTALTLPTYAQEKPSFNTFITNSIENDTPESTPQNQFDCAEKVYSVIEVTAPVYQTPSNHVLLVNWFNPGNKLEQKTSYEFTSYGKGTRVWAWLRLSGPTGAAIGRIFDPAFGMGEFIGQWHIDILIDDKKVASHNFDVLC